MISGSFMDSSRRESRKRRRLSERRRVFSRLGGGPTGEQQQQQQQDGNFSFSQSRDRRRSSLFRREQAPQPDEEPGFLMASGDNGKITMKIQFHITVAPDNEPLLVEAHQLAGSSPDTPPGAASSSAKSHLARRQASTDSTTAIGEHLSERLSRQNSSTRRRQQLLAMHQQSALDKQQRQQQQQQQSANIQSEDNLTTFANQESSSPTKSLTGEPLGREPGVRSSTITGGIQDEATMKFLAKQQQQQHPTQLRHSSANMGGSLTSTGSLLGQHQTLMSSSNNMRHRQEQRQHIYFKRDGQRFGHEFTLKLAVDKSYRCLLKVRPLIPLESLSIQGHHVAFVDCSPNSSFSSTGSSGIGSSLSSSAPVSSITLDHLTNLGLGNSRHQSTGTSLGGPRHNSIAVPTNHLSGGARNNSNHLMTNTAYLKGPADHHLRRLNHAQTTIGGDTARRTSILNSDLVRGTQATNKLDESTTGSNLSLTNANARLQHQLLKQHQHNQMIRHFTGSTSLASSHMGGQLVYMFDWSAGRFEVNKNKARTQVQAVLKFKNGQILSLPLQVKFYQPECKQHLSWGNQLHFIDYDCNIDSMGQMNVDRIQYY